MPLGERRSKTAYLRALFPDRCRFDLDLVKRKSNHTEIGRVNVIVAPLLSTGGPYALLSELPI